MFILTIVLITKISPISSYDNSLIFTSDNSVLTVIIFLFVLFFTLLENTLNLELSCIITFTLWVWNSLNITSLSSFPDIAILCIKLLNLELGWVIAGVFIQKVN